MKKIWLGVAVVVVAAGIFWVTTSTKDKPVTAQAPNGNTAIVEIAIPETLSANAEIGKTAYDAKCAACHAPSAVGQTGVAPPLVHIIYEPSHHGDEAFQRAVAMGVREHH
jgi:cytochrome c